MPLRKTRPEDEFAQELEALVDKHSMQGVIAMLGAIAHEKASHIECNYSDARLAEQWRLVSRLLNAPLRQARDL
jgi:hypothetical protein